MELTSLFLLVFAFVAGVAAVLAAIVTVNATGPRVLQLVKELGARVEENAASVEALRATWSKYRTELEGLLEAVEDTMETTERKRRRAAAYASKLPESAEGDTMQDLRRKARGQGLPI